jgi:hypothetical protein
MIYGTRLIGKELLDTELVQEFRDMYQKLRKSNNPEKGIDLIQKYFMFNNSLSLQFDGFISLFINLMNEKPTEVNQIDGLKEFVEDKCTRLALASNLIIFMLNNYLLDEVVVSILETPYDNFFDKNSIKDESKLKNAFGMILKTNVDALFELIINLRDNFFDSVLYHNYISALKNDGPIDKYEINIQALFYIIKQIIFQYITDGKMKFINEDNIIIFNRKNSLEGNFFEIKFQPSNSLNFQVSTDIIEIIYEGKKELAIITHCQHNFSQNKGSIITIKGEILAKDGLNMNSPTNEQINEFLNKIGHWYRYIDENYRGLNLTQ